MKRPLERALSAEDQSHLSEERINLHDMPERNAAFWKDAKIVPPKTKPVVRLRVSEQVIAFFKQESPKGCTGRMAAVLAAYVAAQRGS